MSWFNNIGNKIRDATQWLGSKIKDTAQYLGEKMPLLTNIANVVKTVSDVTKPLSSIFGMGGINDAVSTGAGWFVNNSSKISNGLEATKNKMK